MNQVSIVESPFAAQKKSQSQETSLVEVESQRAIQEVQAAMVIAKKFPRDQIDAMDRILRSCTRPKLAEGSLYCYPRGGQNVTGPSIRLAEAIAQNWGNIQFGVRELSQSNGESTVEAFAWDLETNTRQVKVFQVPHVRYSRAGGNKKLIDPRDIYEVVANQGARRLRACIFGVIPGDVIESAQNQCEETLKAHIDNNPNSIKCMLESFEQLGVNEEMLKKRIGCRIEAVLPAQMVQLQKIDLSIRDGMSSAKDWFEVTSAPDSETAKKLADAKNLKPAKKKPAAKKTETVATTDEPKAEQQAEPADDIDQLASIKGFIDLSNTLEALKAVGENIKEMIDDDELSEYEIKESRDYLAKAMATIKNG